jgi:subtilisin family serine protease
LFKPGEQPSVARTTQISKGGSSQILKIVRGIAPHWLCLLLLFPGAVLVAGAPPSGPRFVPGQILVKPKASLAETNWAEKLVHHGASHRRTLDRLNVRVVGVPEQKAEAVLAALRDDPEIEFAERDYIAQADYMPNDPYVTSGTAWHLSRIQAQSAWDLTAGVSDILVGVLDSGINAAHPDLAGQFVPGYDYVSFDTDPADDFGHGTAVAGTIVAAGNNGVGSAGVAFGCRVLPVKVVDSTGYATYSALASGIRYATDHGVRVINMSVGGSSSSSTLQAAVNYAWNSNVVLVASAGNNSDNVPQYPSACDHVIAVSATEPDDTRASFSSFGTYVTLSAPGDTIWTTDNDLAQPYGSWRGTSFSSPIVAGVAALMASENPLLSNTQIVALLEQTADDIGAPGRDIYFGFGRVNAFRAVTAASTESGDIPPPPPDTNSPSVMLVVAPKNGARLTVPQTMVSGTAWDNGGGLQEVQVLVNDIAQPVTGTSHWSAQISLAAGLNVLKVRSVDLAGNLSAEVIRKFTFVVHAPINAQINGSGSITPEPNGNLFEIGKTYSLKAVPAPGQVFAGWNGEYSASPIFHFVMQSNLTIVATFVPTPFPPVKGSYAGLAADTNGVLPQSSGCFKLTMTSLGVFTGQLRVGGHRYAFHGRFDLNGDATVSVNRKQLTPLTLAVHVDLNTPNDRIDGSLTDGSWTSALTGDREVFNVLNPAPQAGLRQFVLERADDTSITAATGASTISVNGATSVKGRLQDQRAFSAASLLASNGDYPFYLSFNQGTEVVIGWLNFPAAPSPTASGTVLWVRTGTNAFAATLQAASAP